MATVSLEQPRQHLLRSHAWDWVPSVHLSFLQGLGRLLQQWVGLAMLLFGSAMLFTLWLIPIGLPLAMLGLAFVRSQDTR